MTKSFLSETPEPREIKHEPYEGKPVDTSLAARTLYGVDRSQVDPARLKQANRAWATLSKSEQDEMKRTGQHTSQTEMERLASLQDQRDEQMRIAKREGRHYRPGDVIPVAKLNKVSPSTIHNRYQE